MSKGTGTMSRRGAVKPRNIDVIKQQNKVILELQNLVNQQGLIIKKQTDEINFLKSCIHYDEELKK